MTGVTLAVDDGRGGTASDIVSIIVQDTIPPVTAVRGIAGLAGDNGWYRSDILIMLESMDNCSGVREISSVVNGIKTTSAGNSASVSIQGDMVHTVSFGAKDNAGSIELPTTLEVKIDRTPPAITAAVSTAPNAAGWNNTDVTVTFSCSDALSGVASCPAPVLVSGEGANQIVTGTAVDKAGNSATASVTLNIDKTPPVSSISAVPGFLWPPNHKMVDVFLNGGSDDFLSGVASAAINVVDEYGSVQPSANGFDTAVALEAWREGTDKDGRHYVITAVVTDKAGNVSTVSTEVLVPHDMR